MDADAIIESLRDALGTYAAIAAACNQPAQSITRWRRSGIPPHHCQLIEQACVAQGRVDLTCERMRPDLVWTRDGNGTAYWRRREQAA